MSTDFHKAGLSNGPRCLQLYLQPEVVLRLVRYFPVIIADVTFADQAVDGPLVGVSAVPQHAPVVKTKFVFGVRRKSTAQGSGGKGYR